MTRVLVLSGGISSEREVSFRSGKAVSAALESKGYEIVMHDPQTGTDNLPAADVAFPALHGLGGEDGAIQIALELAKIPYVGSDVAASKLCFDKAAYKKALQAAGLPTADSEIVTSQSIWQSPLITKPFVLKPIDGGSSIDTFIIRDTANAPKAAIEASLQRHPRMLLESLIEGLEITVGVLDTMPLPAVEIIPPSEGEFDYENKYNGKTQEICPPTHLDETTHARAQELALKAHQLTGCRDLSRTDMIVQDDGSIVILETNTLPGMTDQSLYPKAAAAAGVPMADLVDRFVQSALARA
jgi:D-alanine-D-alanine ligase